MSRLLHDPRLVADISMWERTHLVPVVPDKVRKLSDLSSPAEEHTKLVGRESSWKNSREMYLLEERVHLEVGKEKRNCSWNSLSLPWRHVLHDELRTILSDWVNFKTFFLFSLSFRKYYFVAHFKALKAKLQIGHVLMNKILRWLLWIR